MAMKDLTPFEVELYEYIKASDFESKPWVTRDAARKFGRSEEEMYKALSELTKKIRDNIWIYYESGELHVVAE